jgi:hypothetical protein
MISESVAGTATSSAPCSGGWLSVAPGGRGVPQACAPVGPRGAGLNQIAVPLDDRVSGPLGNHAKSASPAGHDGPIDGVDAAVARALNRRERYEARRRLWEFSSLPRLRACGRVGVAHDGAVTLRISDGRERRAGFGGVSACGSTWACPVCSAKVARRRVEEIERLLEWNAERGGAVCLATFTASHHRGESLEKLFTGMTRAWRAMTSGRNGTYWGKLRKLLGCDGYVRVLETTWGDENGWHVHYHLLLVFDSPQSQPSMTNFSEVLYKLWAKGLASQGMTASALRGVDVRVAVGTAASRGQLAGYLTKLTFEAVGGRFKTGRHKGRTPFQILADGLATGDARDLGLWLEWEQASKGRRQTVWTDGLKQRVGIGGVTDEEIVTEDEGGQSVLVLSRQTWRQVRTDAIGLLEAAEQGGAPGAMAWLDRRGCNYERAELAYWPLV